jgi:hypothetical protein
LKLIKLPDGLNKALKPPPKWSIWKPLKPKTTPSINVRTKNCVSSIRDKGCLTITYHLFEHCKQTK